MNTPQQPQPLGFFQTSPRGVISSPSTNTAPSNAGQISPPHSPVQFPVAPSQADIQKQLLAHQQKQANYEAMLKQIYNVLQQSNPTNANAHFSQVQQLLQHQNFHMHGQALSPRQTASLQEGPIPMSPIQRPPPSPRESAPNASPSSKKAFSDVLKNGGSLLMSNTAPPALNLSSDGLFDGPDDSNVVVPFVQGTWKNCTFNQSQLLREFAVIPRKLVKKLVSLAEKEPWGSNNEVLLSYLNYTFRRLIDEKKIVAYFADDKKAPIALCFNTGLLTAQYERIYALLAPNKNLKEANGPNLLNSHKKFVEWFVTLFVKETDMLKTENNIIRSKLGCVPIPIELLPQRTSYFSDKDKTFAKEIVWNVHTPLEVVQFQDVVKNMKANDQLGHIVQNIKDEELISKIRSALTIAIKRAECNPRIAVPQYYWDKNAEQGELQLLLPLDLDSIGVKAACTLRVSPSGKYEVRTVLSLTQAFTNARLIQKVIEPWLCKAF